MGVFNSWLQMEHSVSLASPEGFAIAMVMPQQDVLLLDDVLKRKEKCVCVCVCVCVCTCVRAGACVCACVRACVFGRVSE